jgi:hypothetical protein
VHHNCPECDGFEVDIDMDNITPKSFEVLVTTQQAHAAAHREANRPEVTHIRKRVNPNRRRGDGFYTLKLSAAENGSQTLCGAEATTEDMGYGDTRHAKGLAYVTCEACKQIRTGRN